MEIKECKNPECSNLIVNRRADALYCCNKCAYTHRNKKNRESQLSKFDIIRLKTYKTLKIFLNNGIERISRQKYDEFNLDINIDEIIHNDAENGLQFKLFDIYIRIGSNNVEFYSIDYES